jgi:DNA-binding MarR family transcriptional regulator
VLGDQQRLVLTILARKDKGTHTPDSIAQQLRSEHAQPGATWQGVTRTVASLVRRGLVRRVQLPKMTYYTITPAGQQELAGTEQDK